jgi:hypothetical protein
MILISILRIIIIGILMKISMELSNRRECWLMVLLESSSILISLILSKGFSVIGIKSPIMQDISIRKKKSLIHRYSYIII